MKAEDLMTKKPLFAEPDTKITDIMDMMMDKDIRHVPVVRSGELVGMISDRDLHHTFNLLRESATEAKAFLNKAAADIMQGDVFHVEEEDTMEQIASLLVEQRVGAVPVTDADGQLVGIVSYVDILREIAGES